MANNTIRLGLKIDADASSAKASLNQLHQELNKLQTQNFELGGLDKEFREAAIAAKELQTHLLNATNKFGQIDMGKFAQSMKSSNTSVKTLATSFLNAGKQGQAAFAGLANQIINAQKPALSFSNILSKMSTTLANNIRWQISSSAINAFTGSIQEAWQYTKNMDKALTNIRVVTGKSREEMDELAESSNKMAKELKATTNEIVQGQLIFYQQGDSAELAAEKARITTMAANVSFNSSQEEMAEYLTAIWNSYQVGENELELFVDKLSAVGAATATSMEEIATGMTKVAAAANAVGVTYDQLNATIATISSVTRVSAEQVGTAMKTIYARMGDLKVGKTDEDGITYGQVSKQMKQMGIDIADANGQLRDMGEVVEEIGGKWKTFSKEEQQALVQAVAGKRQYTNLTALFENWNMYTKTLEISKNAMGTLQEQQDAWADSWEGASNRVQASLESLYQHTLDSDAFIGGANVFADFLDGLDWVIEKSGGLESVLLNVGGLLVHIFNAQISAKFADSIDNIRIIFGGWQKELIRMRNGLAELPKSYPGFDNLSSSLKNTVTDFAKLATVENIYLKNQSKMTTAQKTQYNYHKMIIEGLQKERQKLEETSAEHEKYIRSLGKSKTTAFKAGRESVDIDRKKIVTQAFKGDNIKASEFLGFSSKDISKMNGQVSELGNTLKRVAKNYDIELGLEDDEQNAKKVRDALNQLIRELKTPVPDFNFNLKDDIQTSKSALETFTNEFKEMDTESTVTVGKVKQSFTTLGTSLGMSQKDLNELFDGFLKDADDVEVNLGQITQKLNEFTAKKIDNVMGIIDPADEDEAERIRIALDEIFGASGNILNKNGQINSSFKLMGENVTDVKSGIVGFTSALMSGASAGMSITSALDSFTNGDITGGIMGAASAVSSLITAFSSAGWLGLIISALTIGISLWQKYHKTAEEKIQDLNKELETLKGEIESLNGELETTRDRINELQSKGTLSLVEQEELERCLQQEASLERQVRLKEQLEKEAQTEKNTIWLEEQEKEKEDETPAKFTIGTNGQYLKRQGTSGGQYSTGYYYTEANHDEVIKYYKEKIDELNEEGIAYIENASSELEKNINSEILNRYTDLYKALADEARSKGDLEAYADYIADTINEQIMHNPELEGFSENIANLLNPDGEIKDVYKTFDDLPLKVKQDLQEFIDLGLVTENSWKDIVLGLNEGIVSLDAKTFSKNAVWMISTAEKQIKKLKELEFNGKEVTFEQRDALYQIFPELSDEEIERYIEKLQQGKEKVSQVLSELKKEKWNEIKFSFKLETEEDVENFDWDSLINIYGVAANEVDNLKKSYLLLVEKGINYAIKQADGSLKYFDKTGKEIKDIGDVADDTRAQMIALNNQGLLPLSKFPGLDPSLYNNLIKVGQAARLSNLQLNGVLSALNTLSGSGLDLSGQITALKALDKEAYTALTTMFAAAGFKIKYDVDLAENPGIDSAQWDKIMPAPTFTYYIESPGGEKYHSIQDAMKAAGLTYTSRTSSTGGITDSSGSDEDSTTKQAYDSQKDEYNKTKEQAEADLEKGLITAEKYRQTVESAWADLVTAYQNLTDEEKEEIESEMLSESLEIRDLVIEYFDNIYDTWIDVYEDAAHLYGSASKAAELDQAASNALKTLMGTGSVGDLKKVYDEMMASLEDESLPEEEKDYIKKRAEKVNSVIVGMDSQYTDYNFLDYSNVIEDIYQSDKNVTQDEWQELYENKLDYLKEQFENKEISYKKYREEALKLINAGYYDYEKGETLPIFSKDDREDKIADLNDETLEGFDYELQTSPWKFNSDQIDTTLTDFSKNISDIYGEDLSSLTREDFLDLNPQDQEEIREEVEKIFSNLDEALNNGNISFEDYLNARKAIVEEYSAALTKGEEQMYLNEEKAAEDFASNLKSRYDNGELTTKQYVERIKSITGVDDYFKKNEIFAVLNSEIDKFYSRLEDGSITILSDYMSKVKQELLAADLWATEWGDEIWNEALSKGAGYTSSKYKAEYDNLIAQQSLVDWGMTENANNAVEYKMPYAQKWYEQEKANLDYYIENWKGTGSILDDEGYQTLIANVQTAKDGLKALADEHVQFSLDWISHEESMNRLTYAEKVDAYDRILDRIESGYYRQMFANEEEYINWQKTQVAELRQSKIDAAQAEAQQYAEILKEKLEDEKAYYENLKSIREKEFNASQTIREAQHELNLELQKSLTMYEYLDEETGKLIFNTEDYVALSNELVEIQEEINTLTADYEKDLLSASTEEAELLTTEYEAQVELKLKEFEIAKANLEITKKQMALQNTLNERNTRMFINGQWTWVANQEEVAKAREELAEAEFDAETATLEYEHEEAMNQLDNAVNDIQRDINEIDQALEDLEDILNGENGLKVTFEDFAKAVQNTKDSYFNQDDIVDSGWQDTSYGVDRKYEYQDTQGNKYFYSEQQGAWVSEQSGAIIGDNKALSNIDGIEKIPLIDETVQNIDTILMEENELFKKLADEENGIIPNGFELLSEDFNGLSEELREQVGDILLTLSDIEKGISYLDFPQAAIGDIVTRPRISWVGEDGPEAIIPLSPKYRDRGLSLWEEATKALGIAPSFAIPTIKASFPQEKENMNVSQTINVTVQNEDSSNDFYAITNLL